MKNPKIGDRVRTTAGDGMISWKSSNHERWYVDHDSGRDAIYEASEMTRLTRGKERIVNLNWGKHEPLADLQSLYKEAAPKGMNLIEALKTGKPLRRVKRIYWLDPHRVKRYLTYHKDAGDAIVTDADLMAEDWEVKGDE